MGFFRPSSLRMPERNTIEIIAGLVIVFGIVIATRFWVVNLQSPAGEEVLSEVSETLASSTRATSSTLATTSNP